MTLPALTQYAPGLGVFTADWANGVLQTCDTVSQLRAFVGITGMQVYIRGYTVVADGGQGPFYWNATSTATDDGGVTTITPNGYSLISGRWLRLASTISQTITGAEVTLAAATTTDLGTAAQHAVDITGSTVNITSLGSSASTSAPYYFLRFAGAVTLVNSASLSLPGAANITSAANDWAVAEYQGAGAWIVLSYTRASGGLLGASVASNAQAQAGTSTTIAVTPASLASVLQSSSMLYAVDTGAANSITVSYVPTITTLAVGTKLAFKLANTNTLTTVNIFVNAMSGVPVRIQGVTPQLGALVGGQIYEGYFDGTYFQITSQNGNAGLSSGYAVLSGGLILQWGKTAPLIYNVSSTITLPITFPSSFSCVLITRNTQPSGNQAADIASLVNNSSFVIQNNQTTAASFFWAAIGY